MLATDEASETNAGSKSFIIHIFINIEQHGSHLGIGGALRAKSASLRIRSAVLVSASVPSSSVVFNSLIMLKY